MQEGKLEQQQRKQKQETVRLGLGLNSALQENRSVLRRSVQKTQVQPTAQLRNDFNVSTAPWTLARGGVAKRRVGGRAQTALDSGANSGDILSELREGVLRRVATIPSSALVRLFPEALDSWRKNLQRVDTVTAQDIGGLEASALRNAQVGSRSLARQGAKAFEGWVTNAERIAPREVYQWTKPVVPKHGVLMHSGV